MSSPRENVAIIRYCDKHERVGHNTSGAWKEIEEPCITMIKGALRNNNQGAGFTLQHASYDMCAKENQVQNPETEITAEDLQVS